MSNGFEEPQAFSIDESLLEKTLLAIGSGSSPVVGKVAGNLIKDVKSSEDMFSEIPDFLVDEIKEKTKKYVKKLIINNIISSSNKIGQIKCDFGKSSDCILCNHDGIMYKVQGKWTGSEVIILDEDNGKLLVAKSANGSDWENVTDNFIIKKQ